MAEKLSITWFKPDELDLMRRCLEAVASGRYIDNETIKTISGYDVHLFQELARRFDKISEFDEIDFETVWQAAFQLLNYPIENPDELEKVLGIELRYLSWFHHRLRAVQNDWDVYIEDNINQLRNTLEPGNTYRIPAEILRRTTKSVELTAEDLFYNITADLIVQGKYQKFLDRLFQTPEGQWRDAYELCEGLTEAKDSINEFWTLLAREEELVPDVKIYLDVVWISSPTTKNWRFILFFSDVGHFVQAADYNAEDYWKTS